MGYCYETEIDYTELATVMELILESVLAIALKLDFYFYYCGSDFIIS